MTVLTMYGWYTALECLLSHRFKESCILLHMQSTAFVGSLKDVWYERMDEYSTCHG